MAFSRRLLTDGEEVVVELRPSWAYFGWTIPALVGAVALFIVVTVEWPHTPLAIGEALLAVIMVCGLWTLGRGVRWTSTVLVVTTLRLMQRSGVLARRGVEVRLERINEISYHQTILQRLIGTGSLSLDVGGDRGVLRFEHLRRPASVATVVHEEIAALPRTPGPSAAGPNEAPTRRRPASYADDTPPSGMQVRAVEGRSPARQLIELDELRRRGILTDAEFAERRARLIDQL